MTKDDQDATVRALKTLAVDEAINLANRYGCAEPRRIFLVLAFEEIGPDLWAHGSGIGHASDIHPDAHALLKEALTKVVRLS